MPKFNQHQIMCPIHGSIGLSNDEKNFIDDFRFQRLKNIKQLGLTYLVFPSAVHNRFTHSIGVMHIAGKLCDSILLNVNIPSTIKDEIKKRIRLAGLFHDLGHGPLSHFFEHCIHDIQLKDMHSDFHIPSDWFYTNSNTDFLKGKLEHEHISYALIRKILNDENLAQDICSLLDSDIKPSENFTIYITNISSTFESSNVDSLKHVFKSLLSSEIDADRLDYLQRDSYFAGVKISNIDTEHLLKSISLACNKDNEFYIQINPNAISTIEQILISRRIMFNQVYLHRVCYTFGKMLETIIDDNNLAQSLWNRSLDDFTNLTDEKFLNSILERSECNSEFSTSKKARTISQLFYHRIPYSRVEERFIAELNIDQFQVDFKKISSFSNCHIIPILPKEFTKLARDGQKGKHNRPVIKVNGNKDIEPIAINNFSEVLKSSLWRENIIRVLIVKDWMTTAIDEKLEEKVKNKLQGKLKTTDQNFSQDKLGPNGSEP